jgi:hypothetical protein
MDLFSMLAPQLTPHLSKLGDYLEEVDKQSIGQGIKNTAILITKRRDADGKIVTFLAHIEKPEKPIYVKDEQGHPKVDGIESLFSMFK